MLIQNNELTHAQISRIAIQKLYITMKHLFFKGEFKPMGNSGVSMVKALLELKPEIYGSIADPYKVELNGLLYIFERLPKGIEECRNIHLISREGFEKTNFVPIIPRKRRRNCYRIDVNEMYIEMTRGRSDIYDILTHLTFMYIEADKIRNKALDSSRKRTRAWDMLEKFIMDRSEGSDVNLEVGYSYLSSLLGRTYDEVKTSNEKFFHSKDVNDLFNIVYWLGKLSIDEHLYKKSRVIRFSTPLQERLGSHQFGEMWADNIKNYLKSKNLLHRPIHIISANMHSVMNCFYAHKALEAEYENETIAEIAEILSRYENKHLRDGIHEYASERGMHFIEDVSGTNIPVQIFDLAEYTIEDLPKELSWTKPASNDLCPVIIVMDYAFGEQAYETLDELLKPFDKKGAKIPLNIQSINIMGKAGILIGGKGDIMVPTAHVFEGSTDNYPFENAMKMEDLEGHGLLVVKGPMISVLGTSLQNRPILQYFMASSWGMIGLEMEGAHYQKAVQVASKIRKTIREDVVVRYAYYASDNPLETGSTLASGSLGLDGVKPTYLITISMLNGILLS
jgi:hypothetical protein